MEILTVIIYLIGFVITINVLVKFFQIAADIRAIRQSIPMAYKFNSDDPEIAMKDAERAIKAGNKEYARHILLLHKERLVKDSSEFYKTRIAQIDKILSEL
jgi:hypothetical protein